MKYRPPLAIHRGRVSTQVALHALPLLRPYVIADGDLVAVGVDFGDRSSDPFVLIEVDLSHTRAGKALAEVDWRVRKWRGR